MSFPLYLQAPRQSHKNPYPCTGLFEYARFFQPPIVNSRHPETRHNERTAKIIRLQIASLLAMFFTSCGNTPFLNTWFFSFFFIFHSPYPRGINFISWLFSSPKFAQLKIGSPTLVSPWFWYYIFFGNRNNVVWEPLVGYRVKPYFSIG